MQAFLAKDLLLQLGEGCLRQLAKGMQAFLAKDLLLQLGEGCLRQLAKRPEGRRLMIGFTFLVETKAM